MLPRTTMMLKQLLLSPQGEPPVGPASDPAIRDLGGRSASRTDVPVGAAPPDGGAELASGDPAHRSTRRVGVLAARPGIRRGVRERRTDGAGW